MPPQVWAIDLCWHPRSALARDLEFSEEGKCDREFNAWSFSSSFWQTPLLPGVVCGCRFAVRTGGRGPDLGVRSESQAYRKLRCPLRETLETRANESGAAPLHLGIRFISELQLEDIIRYDCDSQKCDIALRTICLKNFRRPLPHPLSVHAPAFAPAVRLATAPTCAAASRPVSRPAVWG